MTQTIGSRRHGSKNIEGVEGRKMFATLWDVFVTTMFHKRSLKFEQFVRLFMEDTVAGVCSTLANFVQGVPHLSLLPEGFDASDACDVKALLARSVSWRSVCVMFTMCLVQALLGKASEITSFVLSYLCLLPKAVDCFPVRPFFLCRRTVNNVYVSQHQFRDPCTLTKNAVSVLCVCRFKFSSARSCASGLGWEYLVRFYTYNVKTYCTVDPFARSTLGWLV